MKCLWLALLSPKDKMPFLCFGHPKPSYWLPRYTYITAQRSIVVQRDFTKNLDLPFVLSPPSFFLQKDGSYKNALTTKCLKRICNIRPKHFIVGPHEDHPQNYHYFLAAAVEESLALLLKVLFPSS